MAKRTAIPEVIYVQDGAQVRLNEREDLCGVLEAIVTVKNLSGTWVSRLLIDSDDDEQTQARMIDKTIEMLLERR